MTLSTRTCSCTDRCLYPGAIECKKGPLSGPAQIRTFTLPDCDGEIQAMAMILEVLGEMPPSAAMRVLRYLWDRHQEAGQDRSARGGNGG